MNFFSIRYKIIFTPQNLASILLAKKKSTDPYLSSSTFFKYDKILPHLDQFACILYIRTTSRNVIKCNKCKYL